jgi:hypothetical protein
MEGRRVSLRIDTWRLLMITKSYAGLIPRRTSSRNPASATTRWSMLLGPPLPRSYSVLFGNQINRTDLPVQCEQNE